jgi:hypothetical protein
MVRVKNALVMVWIMTLISRQHAPYHGRGHTIFLSFMVQNMVYGLEHGLEQCLEHAPFGCNGADDPWVDYSGLPGYL